VVRLRLKRMGRSKRPYYRLAAFDARAPRDGRSLDEGLGTYDPLEADNTKKVTLNREAILAWLDKGAQPTLAVANILKKNGIYAGRKSRSSRRKKDKPQAEQPETQTP